MPGLTSQHSPEVSLLRRAPAQGTGALCCGLHHPEMWPVLHENIESQAPPKLSLALLHECQDWQGCQFLPLSTCRIMSDAPPVLSLVPENGGGECQQGDACPAVPFCIKSLFVEQMDKHLVFTKAFLILSGYLKPRAFFHQLTS